MPFEINKSLEWIAKSLGRSVRSTAPDNLPREVEEGIVAGIDVLGWDRYVDRRISVESIGTAVATIDGPVCPEGEARLVWPASIVHNDAVVHFISVELVETRGEPNLFGTTISPSPGVSVAALRPNTIQGPQLLLPGDFIRGRSDGTLAPGTDLVLRQVFVRLELGEYMPPL